MTHVALLRGINVGGHTKVEMTKLRFIFSELGFDNISTYINSGNVIFDDSKGLSIEHINQVIEKRIKEEFGIAVPVLVIPIHHLKTICTKAPVNWVNDKDMKCDVLFLWKEIDSPEIVTQLSYNTEIEEVLYTPGAVIWKVDRKHINKGKMVKIVGTSIYKKMTVRNINTVRKLLEKASSID